MSNSISTDRLPTLLPSSDDQLARMPAQQPTGESWNRTFEHALGGSFDRWFQAPTERGDATPNGARTAFASTAMSQPAGLVFGHANGARAATASVRTSAGTAARDAREPGDDAAAPAGADGAAQAAMSQGTAAASTGLSATQALVAALGNLVESMPVVAVETPSQALPAMAAPSAAASAHDAKGATTTGDADEAEVAQARATEATRDAAATDERDPLRVHAEWSDAGVRVWLGADAQGLAVVDAVTRQLQQWLGSQGTRLLGVVCNGQEVWSPARGGRDAAPSANPADTVLEHPPTAADARAVPYPPTFI